jgi:hypothetical protein
MQMREWFEKYRGLGAPWAFVLQNNSPHGCTANSKDLILDWLKATIEQRKPFSASNDLARMDQSHGWLGFIRTQPVDTKDDDEAMQVTSAFTSFRLCHSAQDKWIPWRCPRSLRAVSEAPQAEDRDQSRWAGALRIQRAGFRRM